VGLAPYDEDDAAFFFGRSQEVAIASANLRSARLTILYGPSGVGKSSLLQAGVVHGLREMASDESPFAICTVRSWLDDPVRTLQEASRAALQELAGNEPLPSPRSTLTESLHAWTERTGTLLVVLDQFEEYFQYHAEEGAGEHLTGFAAQLATVVNDPNLAVNVLLSIREDAWAKLDRFEGHIPLLFANYLRVDHLDLDAAREAIEAPIAAWNATLEPGAEPYDIEPALIGAVLSAAGGGLAADAETDVAASDRVEAPFLQLVLERLWRATVADGAHVLTLARLEALGGARQIVERHLLDALDRLSPAEQDTASDCFRFLVSSSKSKIAHPAADLAEWTRRPEPQVTTVLDKLCSGESGRILRAVAPAPDEATRSSYELFHDVLAEPILAWRRVHERERSRRAAQRRLVRVGSFALALVAVFAALSVWALIERRHANQAFRAEKVLFNEKRDANRALRDRVVKLNKRLRHRSTVTAAQDAKVEQLRATNKSLRAETTALTTRRDVLDGQIASLRTDNRKLANGIARFNKQNDALATKINKLDGAYARLIAERNDLQREHAFLMSTGDILKADARALEAQRRALTRQLFGLQLKAAALGYPSGLALPLTSFGAAPAKRRAPETADSFEIPATVAGSDSLRRQVEDLERRLANLRSRQERLKNEAVWLGKEKLLLQEQRNALRTENAQLETTRVALEVRNRKLRSTFAAAEAEHERLSAQAAVRESRTRKARNAVVVRRKANDTLQSRNDANVDAITTTQETVFAFRGEVSRLVKLIAPAVDKLVQAAQDPAQDAPLAGLLAVEAYRLTPFGRDDAAHPGVYNALWFALSRLDANAARALIEPVAKPSGKVGTTRSVLIKRKICGVVTRAFTQAEWKTFLPARAPYTAKSPCS